MVRRVDHYFRHDQGSCTRQWRFGGRSIFEYFPEKDLRRGGYVEEFGGIGVVSFCCTYFDCLMSCSEPADGGEREDRGEFYSGVDGRWRWYEGGQGSSVGECAESIFDTVSSSLISLQDSARKNCNVDEIPTLRTSRAGLPHKPTLASSLRRCHPLTERTLRSRSS